MKTVLQTCQVDYVIIAINVNNICFNFLMANSMNGRSLTLYTVSGICPCDHPAYRLEDLVNNNNTINFNKNF